jgi:hypothetical protein
MFQDGDTNELLFGIQRSIRYHDRRIAYFDRWHKVTNVFTILLSGVVLLELTGAESPLWVKIWAAITAVIVAFDLVVGFGHRANEHRDLKRRFCALERRLIQSNSMEDVHSIQVDRSEIEAEEPPIFRALDAMCHNELLTARGYSRTDHEERLHFRKVSRFMRWTKNWLRWPDLPSTVA